ncbi:MAG: universal stress protein, partial [Sphingomonadales bacterium]
ALAEAVALTNTSDGEITGIHAYAAALHDRRFRQMEGGLPDRYREEQEMEHQREVHDDLITQGLNIISDSYHDVADEVCAEAGRPFKRLSPEGKNYRRIVEAAATGEYDVLALGAVGLGAVPGSMIGTVCERVVRRCPIDVLVIKDAKKAIGEGPIVVALDGSDQSNGALKTALDIGRRLGAPVHAIAAYDPYYHYVAFNKIAGVLSEEAGEVFRFKEQEQLHEELIDSGIAKIYQSHLEVARQIADDEDTELTCELLDGKPFVAIRAYVEKVGASLLLVGKTGVHADADLDIGGTTENLLRVSPCHLWIGQTTFAPPLEIVAEETIAWSEEAEALLARAPSFVQGMARKAILRTAQAEGHTFITRKFVENVTGSLMPGRGKSPTQPASVTWSAKAEAMIAALDDPSLASNIRLRAEKHAIHGGADQVTPDHVAHFLGSDHQPDRQATWSASALARLARVPEAMRDPTRARIEAVARERGAVEVTLDIAETGLDQARKAMEQAMAGGGGDVAAADKTAPAAKPSLCPFANMKREGKAGRMPEPSANSPLEWTPEAEARMERIPEGFMRAMSRGSIERFAQYHNETTITPELIDRKYSGWAEGSAKQEQTMAWQDSVLDRLDRIPDFVRGMVMLEVERCARELGLDEVSKDVFEQATESWKQSGLFHSDANPDLYK